jgi:cytochrome c oxidase subunit IV
MAKRLDQPLPWRRPTFGWLAILALLGGVLLIGETVTGSFRFAIIMILAGFMLAALAIGPVGIGRESSLTRLIAGAGFFFILILFLLTFADLLTRLRA